LAFLSRSLLSCWSWSVRRGPYDP